MNFSPELESVISRAISDALVILIPLGVSWLTAKLAVRRPLGKVKKDLNAGFGKIRAHEDYMGIQTTVKEGEVRVTSKSRGAVVSQHDPDRQGQS